MKFSPLGILAAVAVGGVALAGAALVFLFWWSRPAGDLRPQPSVAATAAATRPASRKAPAAPPASDAAPCTILRITDGDTVVCSDQRRIRLLGIDAPERAQKPFGARATGALAELLPVGSDAGVELDVRATDRYGRTLAYLYTPDGRMVNPEMVRRGFALVLTYPPNVRYVDDLQRAQREAHAAKRGLWATDAWACTPRDFRAKRCR